MNGVCGCFIPFINVGKIILFRVFDTVANTELVSCFQSEAELLVITLLRVKRLTHANQVHSLLKGSSIEKKYNDSDKHFRLKINVYYFDD